MDRSIITLILILFVPLLVLPQVTIGEAEMPHANDEVIRTQAFIDPFIDYATTGPAHLWDFADLTVNTEDTTDYLTVASTNFIYAITYANLGFNPNRANHAKNGVDIPFSQVLPIDEPYTFYYHGPDVYRKVGYGVELAGIPVPIIYGEHDVIYELPLEYGNTSSSFSTWNLNIPNLGYYGNDQIRENDVDGWGAITTPAGSFDVLRVRTTLTITDTIGFGPGGGFAVDRPIVREYKWLTPGLRVPVLQINTTEIFGFEVVNAIYYYDVPRSIEVVEPLAASLCPGATIEVPYEATGVYNAGGFFIPANHFTAQLSDMNGDFTSAVDIGDVIATGSGTILATIPANTPLGAGYRIRVISTSPDYIGTDNGFDISIGGNTTAAISADGPTMICDGSGVLLTAVGGPSYQWQRDGGDILGATDAELEVTEAGSYTVVVDNACGAATSNAIAVEVNPLPVHAIDVQDVTLCAGSSLQFNALNFSGQSPLEYQWYLNDAPVPGAIDVFMDASLAGLYTLVATNPSTGCSFTTDATTLTLEVVDAPLVSALGDVSFCEGGSVTLEAEMNPGLGYQWYMDLVAIPGAESNTLVVDASGSYTVVVSNANDCLSEGSFETVVEVNDLPDVPEIMANGPLEFCDGGSVMLSVDPIVGGSYQWSLFGFEILGATDPEMLVSSSGTFSVVVTSSEECSVAAGAAMSVTELALPAVPVITGAADSLLATGTGDFQWSLDGITIPGATDPYFIPVENGNYTVTITDGNGCSSSSEAYMWLSTGVGAGDQVMFSVYPNPTNGPVTIALGSDFHFGSTYEVMDIAGKVVHRGPILGPITNVELDQAAGVYVMRILSGDVVSMERFVVQ